SLAALSAKLGGLKGTAFCVPELMVFQVGLGRSPAAGIHLRAAPLRWRNPMAPFTLSRRMILRVIRALFAVAAFVSAAVSAYGQASVQGQWQTLPNLMPINPVHAALLHNGKVLIVSGSGNLPTNSNWQAGIFDPATGTI